jgi:hypothetical protein
LVCREWQDWLQLPHQYVGKWVAKYMDFGFRLTWILRVALHVLAV